MDDCPPSLASTLLKINSMIDSHKFLEAIGQEKVVYDPESLGTKNWPSNGLSRHGCIFFPPSSRSRPLLNVSSDGGGRSPDPHRT